MVPVDLRVYRDGGLIVRHVAPMYRAFRASPLYDWPGYEQLKFTYPPFAAMVFTVLTLTSFSALMKLSVAVNILALLATIWMTFGALGYRRGLARLGATLLLAAPLLWTEPVQRTLFLGQIEIVLMALIIWDQVQPDRRWWKGAGIGIAAGIKLIPLIFIPYLLLTRRFRQAAVASGTFAADRRCSGSPCCPPTRARGGWTGCSTRAAGPGSSAGRATSRCRRSSPACPAASRTASRSGW